MAYLTKAKDLEPFYQHEVNLAGIQDAIKARQTSPVNRQLLVEHLQQQYQLVGAGEKIEKQIESLRSENTFSVCTAHQPNLFTGPLYFFYKILHAIKLSAHLKEQFPEYHFVPVFFLGSEDADTEELNHFTSEGETHQWDSKQSGAVGRMRIDKDLVAIAGNLAGRLKAEPFGEETAKMLQQSFKKGVSIEEATFRLVHELFKDFGLVILLPDAASLKKAMLSVFHDDLYKHTASPIVKQTSERLSVHYEPQAYARDINLFYLTDNMRNRIEAIPDGFAVVDTSITFSPEEMEKELSEHPERFSPNVILRGLFQEMILPDVAFIGGGGELAYWLQLKDLFIHYEVPFPILILRNSFLILEKKYGDLLEKLKLSATQLFADPEKIFKEMVEKESTNRLKLEKEQNGIRKIYSDIQSLATVVDATLTDHVKALETRQQKALHNLEKKMLRAEKKKYEARERQVEKLFNTLSPHGGLQERVENGLLFRARFGAEFLQFLYDASAPFQKEFCILEER